MKQLNKFGLVMCLAVVCLIGTMCVPVVVGQTFTNKTSVIDTFGDFTGDFNNQRKIVETNDSIVYAIDTRELEGVATDTWVVLLKQFSNGTVETFNVSGNGSVAPAMVYDNDTHRLAMVWSENDNITYGEWRLDTDQLVTAAITIFNSSTTEQAYAPSIVIGDDERRLVGFHKEDGNHNQYDAVFVDCNTTCTASSFWSNYTIIGDHDDLGGDQEYVCVDTDGVDYYFVWQGLDTTYNETIQVMYRELDNSTGLGGREVVSGDNALNHTSPNMIVFDSTVMLVSIVGNESTFNVSYAERTGAWSAWSTVFGQENFTQANPSITTDGYNQYVAWVLQGNASLDDLNNFSIEYSDSELLLGRSQSFYIEDDVGTDVEYRWKGWYGTDSDVDSGPGHIEIDNGYIDHYTGAADEVATGTNYIKRIRPLKIETEAYTWAGVGSDSAQVEFETSSGDINILWDEMDLEIDSTDTCSGLVPESQWFNYSFENINWTNISYYEFYFNGTNCHNRSTAFSVGDYIDYIEQSYFDYSSGLRVTGMRFYNVSFYDEFDENHTIIGVASKINWESDWDIINETMSVLAEDVFMKQNKNPILAYQHGYEEDWDLRLLYSGYNEIPSYEAYQEIMLGSLEEQPSVNNFTETVTINTTDFEMTYQGSRLVLDWNQTTLNVSNITGQFYWNDSAFSTVRVNSSEFYTGIIDIGMGSYSVPARWEYNVSYGNGTDQDYNISTTLTYNFINESTSDLGYETIEFMLRDEDSDDEVTGSIEGTFFYQVLEGNHSYQRNYSMNVSGVNISFYKDSGYSYLNNATLYYEADGYTKRTYIFDNATFDNTAQDVTLYLANVSGKSVVIFTVTDLTGTVQPNSLIQIQKLNEGTGVYNLVEAIETNYDGEAVSQSIELYNSTYRFIVSIAGTVYEITDPTPIFRDTVTISIDLGTTYSSSYDDMSIASVMSVNSSRYVSWTYTDTSGLFHQACLKVWGDTGSSRTWVCYECVNASSSTLECDGSGLSGRFTFNVEGWIDTNSTRSSYLVEKYQEYVNAAYDLFGTMGILASVLLVGTLGMIGLAISTSAGIVMTVLGLIAVVLIGFVNISTPTLIVLALLGAGLAYKMRT